ncbi:unnamed protein product (macronuclear) [Paramecium tetraurelia]|uniref:Uncharacterized protein n=1 Tax=Paramecium tetraurelia TaxID=5888 RepID=A0BIK7_PARTE|nr:uncharacterized protein GSPATT00004746001 [Paramecium tetraurelia]CAK58374.1 unnamed protein product [Paramecium tetraurelia]|eukprot:XP_001425772.1 hypothetical protein (macronuclear) [Paramecium tetraurelia strain d4-2]
MQEAERIKASNKVYLENKFTLKKSQLLDSIRLQISQVQDELEESFIKDKSEVINLKTRIIALQKQVDSNNDLILEQETIIQQLMFKLKAQEHHQLPRKQLNVDQDLLFEFEQELSQLKALSNKLRQKANRLCSYFVCLQLYTADLGLKIQQDDYDSNLLFMPKIPDHSSLISSLQESEKTLKEKDVKVQEISGENTELKKENQNLKRCLKRFNATQSLDIQKQQTLIQQLQDQLNDQQLLISDYFHKIKVCISLQDKQYEHQNQCKQLNDFILRKRKVKNQQPVFNVELFHRKHTLDVCKSREEIVHTSIEPRIHSKTIYQKY